VLVGGGHAHALVLHHLRLHPRPDVHVTVVLDQPTALYSGMFPGFISGRYALDDLTLEVRRLARGLGADVIASAAVAIDPVGRRVLLARGAPVPYDAASVDVGSTVAGLDTPGVREHAWATRPLSGFAEVFSDRVDGPIVVVGGGAAGVELAFCLRHRLGAPTTLVDAHPSPLPATPALGAAVRQAAGDLGVEIRAGRVASVAADHVTLRDGGVVEAARVVWATGAAPHPWLAASGLATGRGGFLAVDATLRVPAAGPLFAAGDCADVAGGFLPRAGVYAVRAAPILAHNLLAALDDRPLLPFVAQRDFLALLDLGAEAIAHKWGLTWRGPSMLRLKERIDRRFMRMLDPDDMTAEAPMDPDACGGCAAKLGRPDLDASLAAAGVTDSGEDAAELGDSGLVGSIDAFPALTGDPWRDGRLAARHALSDLHARGATPKAALVSCAVPRDRTPGHVLDRVLAGVREGLGATPIAGGHTTVSDAAQVTIAAIGASPRWSKRGALPGDRLILTRALGAGLIWHADMRGLAPGRTITALLVDDHDSADVVASLAADDAHAVTDVTGFGLAGHAAELAAASGVDLQIDVDEVPCVAGALDLAISGVRTPLHADNDRALGISAPTGPVRHLLTDPQSGGGLLIAAPPERADAVLARVRRVAPEARMIGTCRARSHILPSISWIVRGDRAQAPPAPADPLGLPGPGTRR
jgi:selenide,water dikinase